MKRESFDLAQRLTTSLATVVLIVGFVFLALADSTLERSIGISLFGIVIGLVIASAIFVITTKAVETEKK